jgi:hypothetical protein
VTGCPFPGCQGRKTSPSALFCSEHYWAIESGELHFLLRMQARAAREPDPARRAHATEQLEGYVTGAVRRVLEKEGRSVA